MIRLALESVREGNFKGPRALWYANRPPGIAGDADTVAIRPGSAPQKLQPSRPRLRPRGPVFEKAECFQRRPAPPWMRPIRQTICSALCRVGRSLGNLGSKPTRGAREKAFNRIDGGSAGWLRFRQPPRAAAILSAGIRC